MRYFIAGQPDLQSRGLRWGFHFLEGSFSSIPSQRPCSWGDIWCLYYFIPNNRKQKSSRGLDWDVKRHEIASVANWHSRNKIWPDWWLRTPTCRKPLLQPEKTHSQETIWKRHCCRNLWSDGMRYSTWPSKMNKFLWNWTHLFKGIRNKAFTLKCFWIIIKGLRPRIWLCVHLIMNLKII